MNAVDKLSRLINNLVIDLSRLCAPHSYRPALVTNVYVPQEREDDKFDLASCFNPFVWLKVPKKRRSFEKRMTRRCSEYHMDRYIKPNKPLKMCIDCGHWHEQITICGNCYKKVKQETHKLMKTMGDHLKYQVPYKEVVVVYNGEEKEKLDKRKYILRVNKERPSWFPRSLLNKQEE